MKKQEIITEVRIDFPMGISVSENLQYLKREQQEIKVPKGGFLKKNHKEVCKAKARKLAYTKIIDCLQLAKEYEGKIIHKEVYYFQGKEKDKNWVVFSFSFLSEKKMNKFKKIFFELYPECLKN